MQTPDESLFRIDRDGKISFEGVLTHADSGNDLQMWVRWGGDKSRDDALTQGDDMHLEPQYEPIQASQSGHI